MFGNLCTRTPPPTTCAANPGKALELKLRDTRGTETTANAVTLLAEVLRARGHSVRQHASWLTIKDGLTLLPRIAEVKRAESGAAWRTATTIETRHAELFPNGVFEFQHSANDDVASALRSGFERFENTDFPVLRAAVSRHSSECTFIDFKERYHTTTLNKARRVVLGPVSWTVQDSAAAQKDEHPFCPCCFFTNSREAMREKIVAHGVFAIRLLAARYPGEGIEADCRVNGVDWPSGKETLLAYAKTWPDRGFEMRKQYILIQDLP